VDVRPGAVWPGVLDKDVARGGERVCDRGVYVTGKERLAHYLAQNPADVLSRDRSDKIEVRGPCNPACQLGTRPTGCARQTYSEHHLVCFQVTSSGSTPNVSGVHDVAEPTSGRPLAKAHYGDYTPFAQGRSAMIPNKHVSVAQIKATLSQRIREAEHGGTVLITRRGRPVAALVSAAELQRLRRLQSAGPEGGLASVAGGWKGSEELADLIDSSPRRGRRAHLRLD